MRTNQGNIFSKEIELLLLSSYSNLNKQDFDRLKYLSTQNIDWLLLNELVVQNRIYVIVYKNLKLIKENIPEAFISYLKKMAVSTGVRNLFFTAFLQKTVTAFGEQGIFVLPFKGPVLSEYVYNDILIRPFSDLDILVNKSDCVQAFNILKSQGLMAQFELKESQIKKYIDDEDHFVFYDPKTKITIELHWDISGLYLSSSLSVTDLKNHLMIGTINGIQIPCLSAESLMVYLCVHGSKHGWEFLEQICCVAEIVKTYNNLDWKKIEDISTFWRCKKMVLLGLYLSKKLLRAPVPESILLDIAKDNLINKMADEVIAILFNKVSTQTSKSIPDRFSLFHLRIRDSITDKVRYVLRLIFRPTDKEWLYFPVPAHFSFIHYFLRPLRLLFVKLRGQNA